MAAAVPLIPVHNAPGIYKKGNRFVVVFRYRGRQRKKSCRTLTEAREFKAKSHLGDAPQASSRMLFAAYAESWLDGYSGRTRNGLRESTRASYEDCIGRIIIPYFKREAPSLKLAEIAPADLKRFIAYLASKYAASSVRRYYAPLRAMLATAAEDGLISRNPAAGMRVVVPAKNGGEASSSNGGKRLTPEQTKQLLAEIPAEHADLVFLLATTGIRIGEALALRWRDFSTGGSEESSVDLAADQPRGRGGSPVLVVSTSKTVAGLRTLALSPATARRFTKRRSMVAFAAEDDPVFASLVGTPKEPHNWRSRVFKPAAERAGVAWATPHKLRHALASMMAENGFSASAIAAQLGHADNGVTALRWYVRSDAPKALDFIDSRLSEEASGA